MPVLSFEVQNDVLDIVEAVANDVVFDVAEVEKKLQDVGDILDNKEEYVGRMLEAIDKGIAYRLVNRHTQECVGAVYIHEVSTFRLYGASMYSNYSVFGFGLLLYAVSIKVPNATNVIIYPHGNNVKYFLSVATSESLRKYNAGQLAYIKINLVELSTKFKRLSEYFGVQQCQE